MGIKKQKMIEKYKGPEAKIEGVKISLANIQTTQALCDTMSQMNSIMGRASKAVDINNIQKTITQFNMATEKNQIVGEMMEDAMDIGEDMTDDADADALIDQIAGDKLGGKTKLTSGQDEMNFMVTLRISETCNNFGFT